MKSQSSIWRNVERAAGCRLLAMALLFTGPSAWGQVTASITGTVKDIAGAVMPQATVTVRHIETGATRTVETDPSGNYAVLSLPVGQYEVRAQKTGFKEQVQLGITLAVAQQAVVGFTLEVGDVEQQVTVTATVPIVNTTLSPTSGLVNEKAVKDLPLNGRSFDQLLTLNVGANNYTSNKSNFTAGNLFSVAGRRPETNRFLMNGVDYPGLSHSSNTTTPNGASGQVLGVEAVREFNVVAHTYGAEYGKRAGGQISIVTSSGTNQLHGGVFEYLRNSTLDARNYFDRLTGGKRIPPFKRNQFGGVLGGPLKKDKVFLFGNYEGVRQRLGLSNVAVVPDDLARRGFLPIGPNNSVIQVPNLKPGMLPFATNFWPAANGTQLGGGLALNFSNPVQKIQEDFGLTRFDYNVSAKDSFSANYLVDRGENDLPTQNANFETKNHLDSHVLGLQETHVFSPAVLNIATIGFGRASTSSGTFPTVSIPPDLVFIKGAVPGTIAIGGAVSGVGASAVTPALGSREIHHVRNYFTLADDVKITKGKHSLSAGVWVQRVQHNVNGTSVATAG